MVRRSRGGIGAVVASASEIEKTQLAARNVLLFLLAFLGLGALGGGGALIVSPSGGMLGMPASLLDGSPFRNFLLPGIVLFFVLGVVPCALIAALVKRPEWPLAERMNFFDDMHWSWTFTIYVAFALVIWIQLEMVFLRAVHWLHTAYMFLAVVILFVALLPQVRRPYGKAVRRG